MNGSGSMENFNFKPIGYFEGPFEKKYEAPRQSHESTQSELAIIKLAEGYNFEQALYGLQKFERVWLVYQFHKNQNWKPKVQTPRAVEKQGVFATRAPYRPNPIGLSSVKLERIEGRILWVSEYDLLDGTPILDIKPYVESCDAFKTSNLVGANWVEQEDLKDIVFSQKAEKQMAFLEERGLHTMRGFLLDQLKRDPINHKKKRVSAVDKSLNLYELKYRTWRVLFKFIDAKSICEIREIYSGYSSEELFDGSDPYEDKSVHREFVRLCGS
jgi:tRNA-Thr(GGU) m(6)t(6)A37 methyltransferase TsaA